MATVTGITAARAAEIEAASVVSGAVDGTGHLILTCHDGSTIDAGSVTGALDADLAAIAGLSPTANDVLQYIAGAWANRTMTQLKASLSLAEGDVSGLVADLATLTTGVSTNASAVALKAPLASPTFTGTATMPKVSLTGQVASPSDALTVVSNLVATDAALGNYFRLAATANFTLSNPTNPTDGQQIEWEIIQDATGSRLITLGSKFALGTDITAVTLTTTVNKRDFLTARYNSTADKWYIRGFVRGYV